MTTTHELINLTAAARRSAQEARQGAGSAVEDADALLRMDDDLTASASRLIDGGWSRTAVRMAIEDGITQEQAAHDAAATLGALGGRATAGISTPRKRRSSKANGRLGGRPIQVLAADCWAIGIHGQTAQEVDEGALAAGTRIRRIESSETPEGTLTKFHASTDGGKHWFVHKTYQKLQLTTTRE
jgi:hypothetical protein